MERRQARNVLRRLDPRAFDVGQPERAAKRVGLRAVKLQDVDARRRDGLFDPKTVGIDEHPDRIHKRRQQSDDLARLLRRQETGALRDKNEAHRIRPRIRRRERVLRPTNAADFDANLCHAEASSPFCPQAALPKALPGLGRRRRRGHCPSRSRPSAFGPMSLLNHGLMGLCAHGHSPLSLRSS